MVRRRAVVNETTVESVILADDDFSLPDRIVATIPDGVPVTRGWTYDGEQFAAPEASVDSARLSKLVALADRRWQAETAGIIVGGAPIRTDERSTAKITAAYVKASQDPGFTVRWKVDTGFFVSLDAEAIISIGDAVTAHVQACFDNEDVLTTAILAAEDLTALDAIDIESGWPS